MAADETLARALIEVAADVSDFTAAMAKAEGSVVTFEGAAIKAAGKAAQALAGGGKATEVALDSSQKAFQRWANTVIRQTAATGDFDKSLRQLEATLKGFGGKGLDDFLASLDSAVAKQKEFAAQEAFGKKAQEAAQLAAASQYVRDFEDALEEAARKEKEFAESAAFDKMRANAEQVRLLEAELSRLAAAEKEAAATEQFVLSLQKQAQQAGKTRLELLELEAAQRGVSSAVAPYINALRGSEADAFIQSLRRQSDAIGKTRADLLELEAAQRGVSAQAAPFIAKLREQERVLFGTANQTRDARVEANRLRTAFAQLPAQITDVVTSLASGIPAYLVLIQQGGQIKDSFGGIGNAARALTGFITPLRVALGGMAGVATAVAVGFFKGQREAFEFQKALVLSGNAAGTTAGRLQALAESQSRVAGTQAEAAAILAKLAASGRIAEAQLGGAVEAAIALERSAGVAADETVKAFIELGKDPVAASAKLNESTRFLTVSLYEQIKALQESGRAAEAAALAQDAFSRDGVRKAQQLESQIGLLEKAWRDLKDAIKAVGNELLNIGRPETLQGQLAAVRAALNQAPRRGANPLQADARRDALRQREGELQELERLERKIGDLQAAQAGVTEEYRKAQEQNKQWTDAALTNQQKLTKALDEYRRNNEKINAGRAQDGLGPLSAEQVRREEQAIRDSFKETTKAAKEARNEVQEAYEDLVNRLGEDIRNAAAEAEAAQNGYNQAQTEFLKLAASPVWREFTNAQRAALAVLFDQKIAGEQAADATRALAQAQAQAARDAAAFAEAGFRRLESAEQENETLRRQGEQIGRTATELAALEAARIRDNAAALEAQAIRLADRDGYEEQVRLLRQEAELLRRRADLVQGNAAAQSNVELNRRLADERERQLEEWQRTWDQVGQSLTDALIEGGKSAAEYLRGLFRTLVLRPVIEAVISPLTSALGGTSSASALNSLTRTFDALERLPTTLPTSIATAFERFATSRTGGFFGLSTTEIDEVGQSFRVSTAAATQFGKALGTASTYLLAFSAGRGIGQSISGGFSASGSSGNRLVNIGTALGSFLGPLGAVIGGAIGGAVNRLFGRRLQDSGIEGTFGGSAGLQGNQFQFFKGGLFRSDKTVTDALNTDLERLLRTSVDTVRESVREYAAALSLPTEAVDTFTQAFRLSFQGLSPEEIEKQIGEALQGFGNALADQFAAAVADFRRGTETTADTLKRLSESLIGVNAVAEAFGLRLVEISVAGGDAASQLAELFGGVDAFAQRASSFYSEFYTEAERADRAAAAISGTLQQFGLSIDSTREQFRGVVEALDPMVAADREALAALLGIADAFDFVKDAAEAAEDAQRDAAEAAAQLAGNLRDAFATLQDNFLSGATLRGVQTGRIAQDLVDAGVFSGSADQLARVLADATREQIFAFADQFDDLEGVSGEAKLAVLQAANALITLKDSAAEAANQLRQQLFDSIFDNIWFFQSPEQRVRTQTERLQGRLSRAGVDIDIETLLGATKQQIFEFAEAFVQAAGNSDEAKIAVVEVAGALAQLRDSAAETAAEIERNAIQDQLDEIARVFGDLSVVDDIETVSEAYSRNTQELQRLEEGLDRLLGTVDLSIQEVLGNLLRVQESIRGARANIAEAIEDALLDGLSGPERIAELRRRESRLFAELNTSQDPAAVAAKLQAVVLERIREEAALRAITDELGIERAREYLALSEEARKAEQDALRDQIDGLERLKRLAADIAQFTGSLRFSDISPLSPERQLNAARSLFESTLAGARAGDEVAQGNLTGNARAFLDEARSYFASSAAYAQIFNQVVGSLDALGLGGLEVDPQIAALEEQLAVLEGLEGAVINTSADEVAALQSIDAALARREAETAAAIAAQTELAREQIRELRGVVERQEAQLRQQAEIAQGLYVRLDDLNTRTQRLLDNEELAAAAP